MINVTPQILAGYLSKVTTWNPVREAADREICYIDLGSVDNESKQIVGWQKILGQDAPSRARQLVQSGDILVSTVRPNLNGVARVPKELDGATASTGFCVLRPDPRKLSPEYLFQWVKSPEFVKAMVQKATGASYPAVSDRIVFASSIPFVPLAEQKRISAILDQVEELRQKRQRSLMLTKSLPQAVFHSMFYGDEFFPEQRLDELCSIVTDGTHYTPTYVENGVVFLSAKNVTSGYIDWSDVKYIPQSLHLDLEKRVSPKMGDVLLAKNGTTGVSAVVDKDITFDIYVSLALLRPGANILSVYLNQAISSPECRRQFHASLKGIGVSNLHLVDIRRAKIPAPPLAIQNEFVKKVEKIEAVRRRQEAHLSRLNSLFAALQHRAFSGGLTLAAAERELETVS